MGSDGKRVGSKLSNALLSPRFLRHRDVTLLAEDVFNDDLPSLTPEERNRLTKKTNSYGTINSSSLFSSPVLGGATSKLSKVVPRKMSLSSLMSGVQLEKVRDGQTKERKMSLSSLKSAFQLEKVRDGQTKERKMSLSSLKSAFQLEKVRDRQTAVNEPEKNKTFRSMMLSEPIPTIQFQNASSSESIADDSDSVVEESYMYLQCNNESGSDSYADDAEENQTISGLREDTSSPFSTPPTPAYPYWERRRSEVLNNRKVGAQLQNNIPKNVSSSLISSPVIGNNSDVSDQRRSTVSCARVRKKPVTELNKPYGINFRPKLDNFDNCCSDSEVTAKPPKSNSHIRPNCSSFSAGNENIRPAPLPLHQNSTSKDNATTNFSSAGNQELNRPKSLPSSSTDPSFGGCFSTAKTGITCNRLSESKITSKSPRFGNNFVNSSDITPDTISPQDVKRSKPFFSVSPSVQRRSPIVGRRKSPYKELAISGGCLDPEGILVISHLPPKSPGKVQNSRSQDKPPDRLQRCASAEDLKQRKNKSQTKQSKAPRRSIATDGWHPVSAMMTNYQLPGLQQDDDIKDSSNGNGHRNLDDQARRSFDEANLDVLKISPDEWAKQLTLLDLPPFVKIVPDEITGCGWTNKDKWLHSPNVCEMTQRFNNTSFWVIREVLNASTLKIRSDIITHFIKIAKKLLELNNLHSLMAVIQSLNSSSIIRLKKTWALISKSSRATFDRLLNLVKIDGNRSELRAHMEGIKLPCIPFLGMYLSDVIYINSAHPSTGGMESHERSNKMNNILRVLACFQQSRYDHLEENPPIKSYLNSVKYIEELEKFLEEDNYKLSLKIEPPPSISTPEKKQHQTSSKDDVTAGKSDSSSNKLDSYGPSGQEKFTPSHRKTKSLEKEYDFQSTTRTKSDTAKNTNKRHKEISLRDTTQDVDGSTSSSGSLPRSAFPTITTSLLDDSIITTSSMPSASSSTSHVSYSTRHSASIESTRSASISDHSDPEDSTWTSDQNIKRWSLPKNETSTKWHKVYHGNRGKYSLRAVKAKPEEQKSSTYPIEKNSSLHAVYRSYINNAEFDPTIGEVSENSMDFNSALSGIDEFVKLRSETSTGSSVMSKVVGNSDYDHYIDDDEVTLIEKPFRSPKIKSGSRSQTDAVEKVYSSISNLSLQLTEAATKAWKQYFKSPVPARRWLNVDSRSEMDLSDPKLPEKRLGKTVSAQYRSLFSSQPEPILEKGSFGSINNPSEMQENCKFEGCLRRKCVLKNGKKPSVSPWSRYWLSLCGTTLVYYASKTITSKSERHHFKTHPYKSVSILNWTLLRSTDPAKHDSFQLSDPHTNTVYRFQCDSKEVARIWMKMLEAATQGYPQPEKDLINLDDS